MKKKELQRLSLEKFRISRLNTNSSSRVIGGNTINTQLNSQVDCLTIPEICTSGGYTATIHVDIITHTCLPDPKQK